MALAGEVALVEWESLRGPSIQSHDGEAGPEEAEAKPLGNAL